MKSVIGSLVVALFLAAAGGICWMLGGAERRVAQAHESLATMRYANVADTGGDLEKSLRVAARVPRLGSAMISSAHEDRSTAAYWLKQYDALLPQHDSSGAVVERDAEALLTASNAAYRSLDLHTSDRQALVRSLDAIIKSYAEVLKTGAGSEDAAYNYEFLVRQRDSIARTRGLVGAPTAATTDATASIHGHQGAPPRSADTSSFKIIIPKRSEERDEELKAGTGDVKRRKG
jgi:hypothetical protein